MIERMATLYVSTSYLKTVTAFATHTRSGVQQIMCFSHLLLTWGLQGSRWDHLWYHHCQLLVWCFLLLYNIKSGWANSAMETKEMFAFCTSLILRIQPVKLGPTPQHSSKYKCVTSSGAKQLLVFWVYLLLHVLGAISKWINQKSGRKWEKGSKKTHNTQTHTQTGFIWVSVQRWYLMTLTMPAITHQSQQSRGSFLSVFHMKVKNQI